MASINTSFIPDLPVGPLDEYRQKAKFDWKKLRIFFESADGLKVKYAIWNEIETDPVFKKSSATLPIDEQKKVAALQMKRVMEKKILPEAVKTGPYQKRVSQLNCRFACRSTQFAFSLPNRFNS